MEPLNLYTTIVKIKYIFILQISEQSYLYNILIFLFFFSLGNFIKAIMLQKATHTTQYKLRY